jgi:hypothetical protein
MAAVQTAGGGYGPGTHRRVGRRTDRRSEERTMSRSTVAHAQLRVRALISLATLVAMALVTEAGHRW